MVLQNYQTFIEITANMIYLVALGLGLKCLRKVHLNTQCTEVRFASLLSGRFSTMAVINPPKKKLANRTSVQCIEVGFLGHHHIDDNPPTSSKYFLGQHIAISGFLLY